MKKKSLWIITALMSAALIGVFVMQMYYIREAYNLKSQLFEQDVNQALSAVVNNIQKRNVIRHINRKDKENKNSKKENIRSHTDSIVSFKVKFKENDALRKLKQRQQIFDYIALQDSLIRDNFVRPEIISEEDFTILSNPNPNKSTLNLRIDEYKSADGAILSRRVTPFYRKRASNININKLPDTIRYLAYDQVTLLPQFISFPSIDPELRTKFKLEDAKAERKYEMDLERLYADTLSIYSAENFNLVRDVAKELENKNIPLKFRIPPQDILDTLIKAELLSKNITLDYNYWVTSSENNNKIVYQNVLSVAPNDLPNNTFRKVIFANDLVTKDPGMLYLSFPNKNSLIFSNMMASLLSSVGLLLTLIFIFAYTIYAIIKQKKLSEMKNDFINNMTHEFKTPVATIMIASEALKDPDLTIDKARINRLASIIYDENVRLGNHIERVLNVAKLDNKELQLASDPIALNDLVLLVVDSMGLQLQKKDANLTLNLDANPDVVLGDEMHLSNVIFNLIDNANKYSPEKPDITITTKNLNNGVVIEVADKGIGMTKEQTKRIFDQFYRVPTGNLHDVKGFGLGLSYVYNIIQQMNGTVKVQSERDLGTAFVVYVPFK